jgi:hypothetical protein
MDAARDAAEDMVLKRKKIEGFACRGKYSIEMVCN